MPTTVRYEIKYTKEILDHELDVRHHHTDQTRLFNTPDYLSQEETFNGREAGIAQLTFQSKIVIDQSNRHYRL